MASAFARLEAWITLTEDVEARVQDLVKEAFRESSASEHGECTIVWPQGARPGETLTAWRGDMRANLLGQLRGIQKQPAYRVAERMLLLWNEGSAAEHAIFALQ